ncbi:PREDICTED: LOC109946780, partial [Prunus dulcis]
PSLTKNIGGQAVQAGEVIITSIIAAGDLELPFEDEEEEILAEQPAAKATPFSRRNKRKETAPAQDTESPHLALTRSKRLRKRTVVDYVATEPTAALTTTSGTDEKLREAFEAIEHEKEVDASIGDREKTKEVEEE